MLKNHVLIIGILPPPLSGLTLVTQKMLDIFNKNADVRIVNLSHQFHKSSQFSIRKVFKVIYSGILIIYYSFTRRSKIYMPVHAGKGMLFTLFLTGISWISCADMYLHHHSWAYISTVNLQMSLINYFMKRKGTHILLCDDMLERFSTLYPGAKRYIRLSNATFFKHKAPPNRHAKRFLSIGHLSNLSIEKGLDIVIQTFREILNKNIASKLILAGSPVSPQDALIVESAKDEFGKLIELRGDVYGNEKSIFYDDIDVFIFPSKYRNEAQPLVIFEALQAGLPVIAYDRGCICKAIESSCGLCLPKDSDFAKEASCQVEKWLRQKDWQKELSRYSSLRMESLHNESLPDVSYFISLLTNKK